MKIQVITSCTGEKLHSLENQLTQEDFRNLNGKFTDRENELATFKTPAEDLYTGQQHVRLMQGLNYFRDKRGAESIDLWILSAGYGLIRGDREVVPYECTFQCMKSKELIDWSDHIQVSAQIRKIFAIPADFTLVLLSDPYLRALQLESTIQYASPTLFFTSRKAQSFIKGQGKFRSIPLFNQEAKRFSCGLISLKGELGKYLLKLIAEKGQGIIDKIFDKTVDVLSLLEEEVTPTTKKTKTVITNPNVDKVISIPQSWWDKPHREKLRFFIPEWDDLVDPDYNFETETHSGGSGDWSNQVYAHQLYPEPSYDGILISKVVAEQSAKKKERINRMGVHRFLRVPREFSVMGDCGAFDYIMKDEPPFTTNEILEYYTRLDFDYGVSVDHLIVKATEEQKKYRYELTINNAEEFINEHRKRGLKWEPIGAVQGWDPQSYAQAARQYVAMGYRYIALGGLVRTNTPGIINLLQEVHKVVPENVKIHLFGIARFQAMADFVKLGVSSVDSASMLRKAWLGSDLNYLTLSGWYSAIRIPQSEGSYRAKNIIKGGNISLEELQKLEKSCLDGLRKYARSRNSPSQDLIEVLVEYDTLVAGERKRTKERILRTLEDQPWEKCGCAICNRWGIEVAIFRGNNRNRRRGFHNTHVFYELMQRKLTGERVDWLDPEVIEEDRQLKLFDSAVV